MARLNLEERFFGDKRVIELAHELNCTQFEAIGLLVTLWHSSQERGAVKATRSQIAKFCLAFQKERGDLVVNALLNCSFIKQVENDKCEIKGNAEQIKALKNFRERARKGGKATQKKFKEKNQYLANHIENTEENVGLEVDYSSSTSLGLRSSTSRAQYNSIQDNTIQNNIVPKGTPTTDVVDQPKAAIDYEGFLRTWNENCGSLPKVSKLSSKRKAHVKTRLAENPDLGYWRSCVERMAKSNFCVEGKWATFDWLVKNDNNHVKVSEGNYDNKSQRSGDASAEKCYCNRGKYRIDDQWFKCPLCADGDFIKVDWPLLPEHMLETIKSQQTFN